MSGAATVLSPSLILSPSLDRLDLRSDEGLDPIDNLTRIQFFVQSIIARIPDRRNWASNNISEKSLAKLQEIISNLSQFAVDEHFSQSLSKTKEATDFLLNIVSDYSVVPPEIPINKRVQSIAQNILRGSIVEDGYRTAGVGAAGQVLISKAQDGQFIAMKMLSEPNCSKESRFLKILIHPNIIQYIYRTERTIYMEAANPLSVTPLKSLFQPIPVIFNQRNKVIIAKSRLIKNNKHKQFLMQVILGLNHMHSLGIVHGDVKPDNVVLDNDGNVKIIDFDSACFSGKGHAEGGTPPYRAPEVPTQPEQMISRPHTTTEADAYAVGIMIQKVYEGFSEEEAFGCFENDYILALDLSRKMTCADPRERLTMQQALDHPFFAEEV